MKNVESISVSGNSPFTVPFRVDGFGHQYLSIMNAIAYAVKTGKEYRHTAFRKMEHDTDPEMMDEFIGIKYFFAAADESTELIHAEKISKLRCVEPKPHIHGEECNNSMSIYFTKDVIDKLRKFYLFTPKPLKSKFDIIIHIRRGDVTPQSPPDRYVPNNWYVKIISFLKNKYPNKSIAIYSEGSVSDFSEISDVHRNIDFVLNGDARDAHYHMTTADVLVISESGFSRTAAILSRGTIFYIPPKVQQMKVLPHWKPILL